jgi:hypothetical protein
MKNIQTFFLIISLLYVTGCDQKPKTLHTVKDIEQAYKIGNLTQVTQWANTFIATGEPDSLTELKLKTLVDMAQRINADFKLPEEEVISLLNRDFSGYSETDRELWEKNNWLEFKVIDGKKRFFKRALSNLKLILLHEKFKQTGVSAVDPDHLSLFCLGHTGKVISLSGEAGKPVHPVKMKICYQLIVNADAVPDGEIIRCWLPWPSEKHPRQTGVKLLKTFPDDHYISPDSVLQHSVYLEQKALKGKSTLFELQFEYISMAQSYDLSKVKTLPYNTASVIVKKFTTEQTPQIIFTNQIQQLSDSIVAGSIDPAEKVRKIYYWINDHIVWTGALEYSIIPFIPGYVLSNRRGDCGMQTLLFMALARYQGIPVKWQSGWMMHPKEVNLHDWCEVYYEGAGWIPLDMSFNLQKSPDIRQKEFYISGIDAYRLIVNDGIGSRFVPDKKYARSEPYDFQRGEVEWREGNLYFNQWDYSMKVEYY